MSIISNSSALPKDVRWPQTLTDETADLAGPLDLLLIDLGINPTPEDAKAAAEGAAGNQTPVSVAIIEAGATEFSRQGKRLVGLLGGGTAIAGGLLAYLTGFWNKAGPGVRIATVAGAAFVIASAVLAIAVIVASDVGARGRGSAAQYDARARIADAYLRGAATRPVPAQVAPAAIVPSPAGIDAKTAALLVGATSGCGLRVQLTDGTTLRPVWGARFHGSDGQAEVFAIDANRWVKASEVVEFEPASSD